MSVSVHLPVYMPMHMSVHLSVHMSMHMSMHVSIHMPVHMSVHTALHRSVHMSIPVSVHVSVHVCLYTCLHTCLCTCLCTCLYTCLRKCLCTGLHTCLHARLYTCLYTRRYAQMPIHRFVSLEPKLGACSVDGLRKMACEVRGQQLGRLGRMDRWTDGRMDRWTGRLAGWQAGRLAGWQGGMAWHCWTTWSSYQDGTAVWPPCGKTTSNYPAGWNSTLSPPRFVYVAQRVLPTRTVAADQTYHTIPAHTTCYMRSHAHVRVRGYKGSGINL